MSDHEKPLILLFLILYVLAHWGDQSYRACPRFRLEAQGGPSLFAAKMSRSLHSPAG